MEVVIQVALMFFFIQFAVVMTIMVVAMLVARPEVPVLGRESGHDAIKRSFAFVVHMPGRAFRSVVRVMHHIHWGRTAH